MVEVLSSLPGSLAQRQLWFSVVVVEQQLTDGRFGSVLKLLFSLVAFQSCHLDTRLCSCRLKIVMIRCLVATSPYAR